MPNQETKSKPEVVEEPREEGLDGTSFDRRKGRPLTVNGTRWKWRTGKGGGVVANSDNGKRLFAWAGHITGRDFERGQWKRTSDGMVTPSDVAAWISSHNVNMEARRDGRPPQQES